MIENMNSELCGSHHCTRENISATIARLKEIESDPDEANLQSWIAECGIMALQFKWLLSNLDDS